VNARAHIQGELSKKKYSESGLSSKFPGGDKKNDRVRCIKLTVSSEPLRTYVSIYCNGFIFCFHALNKTYI